MNKIKLLFMVTTLLTWSCSKEEPEIRLSQFETPVVTGFELRDEFGNLNKVIGNPNIKLGNESNDHTSEYYFITFPNPSINSCRVNIKTPNPHSIKRVWIVEAKYFGNSSSSTTHLGASSLIDVGGSPLIQSEGPYNGLISIDLSSLKEGYYRIYLEVDHLILYDNLIIENN